MLPRTLGYSCVLLAFGATAFGRPVPHLTYDELLAQSDVVVIATAAANSDVDDRSEVPDGDEDYLTQLVTTLKPKLLLKGSVEHNALRVVHLRLKDGKRGPNNGPNLISFETKGPISGKELLSRKPVYGAPPEYLLFLKRRKDGAFVPVTGQFDSKFSARCVEWPNDPSR